MVVPVWAEPLMRCYSTSMVLLPTRRIFDFSTSCLDIATSGRLSDTYVLITFELIFWAGKWRHQRINDEHAW